MHDDDSDGSDGAPTRREYITYGGAVVGGGLLAGCTGTGGSGSGGAPDPTATDPRATEPSTETETSAETEASTDSDTDTEEPESTGTDGSYEVCIEPVGCVAFEEIPETYVVYNGAWADMAFALGRRDGFLTGGNMIPGFLFEPFGLTVPPEGELPVMWDGGWDKELFYELGPDVILADPNLFESWDDSWDESDTEEIRENVAPWFGSNSRRRREFHDYRLYTLYECFEKVAAVFQERERYEAFVEVHEDLRDEIGSRLPPEGERPAVGLINGGSEPSKGKFFPLDTQDEGYEMKPYRDLGVESAFPDDMEGGQADYETLLEVDPEIIIVHWGIGTTGDADSFSAEAFREQYVTPMEKDSVGGQLTAVRNGTVYPGQYGEQGPLANLLQTEMVAQQLYPEEFGAFAPEEFPTVPEDRRLFDRQRVRDIIEGDV